MDTAEFFRLLIGTVIHRPYVYAFFVCFLFFASYHLGWKRTITFLVSTYIITFLCEYSSTRNGFPFGPYTYFDETRTRELWISNVPFWDSLSFVFLSYFSYVMAAEIMGRNLLSRWVPLLGGVIMMLLDVVIDPITLKGDKWFLGKIYIYPYEGFYFGVTAANFAGWFFVGYATQRAFQVFLKLAPWCKEPWRKLHPLFIWAIYGVYAGVFAFNFAITVWVKEYTLAMASFLVSFITLFALATFIWTKRRGIECRS